MAGLSRLAVIAPIAVLLLVVFQQAGSLQTSPTAFATDTMYPGDVDCSGATNGIDSLKILSFAAGIATTSADCVQQYGNVNCDASVNAADSTLVLRYAAELPLDLTQSCPAIGGPPTPEALTRALNVVTTAGEADWVLKLIYQQLGVGVYTGDGQQILAGTETDLDTDFYLYDFESELQARNYVGGHLYGIKTLTLFLTEAGLLNAGQPLTDADVLSLLAAKVSASRGDKSRFTWRLIDELGLAHEDPLDLTDAGLDPATTKLDSIQIFLALHDLTLGLAGTSASGEVHALVKHIVDLPTKALHDWATENVSLTTELVEATHSRPTGDSTTETRTFTVTVKFPPVADDVVVLSGPLAGYDPAEFLSGVEGFPVWWYPEDTLVPGTGVLVKRATTDATNDSGVAKVDFLPNIECPNAKGSQATQTYAVQVEVQPLIKSIFPPHTELGLMSEWATAEIQVTHRRSSLSLGADSVAIEAINGLDQLPCTWAGTGHGTTHHYIGSGVDEVGAIDVTFTFGNLQFDNYGGASYDVIGGSATWHASGHNGSCNWSKNGTEDVQGGLTVAPGTSGGLEYAGTVATKGQDRETCGDTIIIATVQVQIGCAGGDPLLVTGLDLTGSCNSDNAQYWHDEFNWHLDGISCSGFGVVTPQAGTCPAAVETR